MVISPTASWIRCCMQVYVYELMWICLVWAKRSTPDSVWVPSHRFKSAIGEQKGITQTIYTDSGPPSRLPNSLMPSAKLAIWLAKNVWADSSYLTGKKSLGWWQLSDWENSMGWWQLSDRENSLGWWQLYLTGKTVWADGSYLTGKKSLACRQEYLSSSSLFIFDAWHFILIEQLYNQWCEPTSESQYDRAVTEATAVLRYNFRDDKLQLQVYSNPFQFEIGRIGNKQGKHHLWQ